MTLEKYLKRWTGDGAAFWMQQIEKSVGILAGKTRRCRPAKLFGTLARVLELRVFPRCADGIDGNLAVAGVLSVIVTLWYARVARAKGYDPRRPFSQRRRCVKACLVHRHALLDALDDESRDGVYFPDQKEFVQPARRDRK